MKEYHKNFTARTTFYFDISYFNDRLKIAVEKGELEKNENISPDLELYSGKNSFLTVKRLKYGNAKISLLMNMKNGRESSRLTKLLKMNVN